MLLQFTLASSHKRAQAGTSRTQGHHGDICYNHLFRLPIFTAVNSLLSLISILAALFLYGIIQIARLLIDDSSKDISNNYLHSK
jgi:hypothetical protein